MGSRKLAYHVHVTDDEGVTTVFGPEDTVPGWAAKKITNPSAWADTADSETDDEPDPGEDDTFVPYLDRKKADLEQEVADRNEGRDEEDLIEVEAPGNKAELAAALDADDQAQADQA